MNMRGPMNSNQFETVAQVAGGGGHWGLLGTEKPRKKSPKTKKTEIYFNQNRTQNHLMVYAPQFLKP